MKDSNVLVSYDARPLVVIRCPWPCAMNLDGTLDWYAKEYGFEREKLDALPIETVYHPSSQEKL